jgi:hypothetical protein
VARLWTLEEELRIGTVEGDVEYQFGQVGLIAVDSRDRIFVIDAQARRIRVFSSDGTHEQTIGQPGEGPGDLGALIGSLYMGPGVWRDDLDVQYVTRLRIVEGQKR